MKIAQTGKKIGIFGLGKTGEACYAALDSAMLRVCYDDSTNAQAAFKGQYGAGDLKDLSHPDWRGLDKIIVSPGVSRNHAIFTLAKTFGIPITSDIELLYEANPEARFVVITGTNGKSTTTALIAHILKCCKFDYAAGGNIGVPALSLPPAKQFYILELSSFQLDLLQSFRADIAILLNISPDHLDRYGSMENYIKSKERVFSFLAKGSIGIIGIDTAITAAIYERQQHLAPISGQDVPVMLRNPFLQGAHNLENIAAAYAVCKYLGIGGDDIIGAIESFEGLPHRMQYLGKHQGITFYNDSKATNADSAAKSISALENIYWLAGGIGKEGGIEGLAPLFTRIKKAYLFGRDKRIFAATLEKGGGRYQLFDNLEEAFHQAVIDADADAPEHKNILLAPAAASYDQFKNFEERGNQFIDLVIYYKKLS